MEPLTSEQGLLIIIIKQMEQEQNIPAEVGAIPTQATAAPVTAAPTEVKRAGFWIRLVAYFIDVLIIATVSAVLANVVGVGEGSVDLFGNVLLIAYLIYMTIKYQATLGKQAMGLMVVSEDRQPLTLNQVVMREFVGRLINAITLGLGYVLIGFDGKKQGLHDKIAHTLVVYGKK